MPTDLTRRGAGAALGGLLIAPALVPETSLAAADTETRRAHTLFDRYWDESARWNPEGATYRGDHHYDDRYTDASPEGIAARDAWVQRTLAQARAIRRDALAPADRLSLDVLTYRLSQQARLQAFDGYRRMSLGAVGGFQNMLSELVQVMPADKPQDIDRLLARYGAFGRRVDQEIAQLRIGAAQGYVSPRPVVERALSHLGGLLAADPAKSPYFEPFGRLGAGFSDTERDTLRQRGRTAIEQQVYPALARLRDYVAGPYAQAAPADGGLLRYPQGERIYAELVRNQTTTELSAQQVHALGQEQLARLRGEMEAVMRGTGFDGGFAAFVAFLTRDPQFFHTSPEALLAGYQAIGKRIDPELPKLFAELPRTPYGVRAMPAHLGPGAAENYTPPPQDGSRAGWFNANTVGYAQKPTWAMETLVAHEAVPGHHLQNARARERTGLPAFRRASWYPAYGEGWALYAETLGFELGLYRTPYNRFGHLQAQAFRAARLVVDTGLHAMGWTRQQAIDLVVERTGQHPDFIGAEVDRYLSMPGQALAYMVGELKIIELRDNARRALGGRFDIRRFHNAVLDDGALPLAVLEQVVAGWVAGQQRSA